MASAGSASISDTGPGPTPDPILVEAKGGGWVLAAAVAGSAFSPATLINVPFGLFLINLQDTFGWSRGQISLSLTVFIGVLIATLPFVGGLLDRYGARRLLLVSIPAYALALMSLAWLGNSLTQLYATFAVLALLSAGTQSLTYITLLSNWFDRRRGLAIGLCMAGFGGGYIIVPQFVQWLIVHHGWRSAYVGLGVLALVGAFLPALAWIRSPPPRAPVEAHAQGPASTEGMTVGAALRTREFWVLATVFILASLTLNGIQSQIVPLLVGDGMAPAAAALMLSAIGVGSCPGRILAGYLMDRIFAPRVVLCFFLLSVFGLGVLILGGGTLWILLAAICIGLSLGAENDAMGYIAGRYFGLRSFGRIYSLLLCAYLTGSAIGPYVLAVSYDATGSYTRGLLVGLATLSLSCVLLLLLPRRGALGR